MEKQPGPQMPMDPTGTKPGWKVGLLESCCDCETCTHFFPPVRIRDTGLTIPFSSPVGCALCFPCVVYGKNSERMDRLDRLDKGPQQGGVPPTKDKDKDPGCCNCPCIVYFLICWATSFGWALQARVCC